MNELRAVNVPATANYSSDVSGEFNESGNEFILKSSHKGNKATKIYSVSKSEDGLVVEKHIKFFNRTIGKFRISPRSVLFRSEAKKVYTAIAKNYLKKDFNELNTDSIDGPNEANRSNLKRLMTQFHTQDSVVALVADLPPKEGAKLLAWCAANSEHLQNPLSRDVRSNSHGFVARCVNCAIRHGYGSKYSPYNPEANTGNGGKYLQLMDELTQHNEDLAVGVVNTLAQHYPNDVAMQGCINGAASMVITRIIGDSPYTQGSTPVLAKLSGIDSPKVRNAVLQNPMVVAKLLPELKDVSLNPVMFRGLTPNLKCLYGESLTQYSTALVNNCLVDPNHYLTNAFSTGDVNLNAQSMLCLYDSISDETQKRSCHQALLRHTNMPSSLKYLSEMDKRRNDWEENMKRNEITLDFKTFVGAHENGNVFSVDRARLRAFVNSNDISDGQKMRCFQSLHLYVVQEIANNRSGEYQVGCADFANRIVKDRCNFERSQNSKFQFPHGQLQLRDNRVTVVPPQQVAGHPYILGNQGVFNNAPNFYNTATPQVRPQLDEVNQAVGGLLSPFFRRERVDHQHRVGAH